MKVEVNYNSLFSVASVLFRKVIILYKKIQNTDYIILLIMHEVS